MDAEDFEFEERAITKAVGLSFHRLDLGVGAFQRSGGDRVVVIGQDAFLVAFQGVRELGQHADTGGTGTSQPIPKDAASVALELLVPDLPEILLEVIGDGQRGVQAWGVFQALVFVACAVEVLRVLQEQPTGPLENLAVAVAGGLVIQLAAQGAELVVEELDDMEVIEHVHRSGKVVAYGPDVGGRHVGGDRDDLGPRPTQPPPKRLQGLDAFAVADENHSPRAEVEDHRQVMMPLADGDLIDGDFLEFVQLGLAKATLQGMSLDVLDGVPTDLQVLRHVLDRHAAGQLQDVALETARVTFPGVGESEFHLPGLEADKAHHPWHLELEQHRFAADRQRAKSAFLTPLGPDVGVPALGATQAFAWLFNANGHPTAREGLTHLTVANNAERMIQ